MCVFCAHGSAFCRNNLRLQVALLLTVSLDGWGHGTERNAWRNASKVLGMQITCVGENDTVCCDDRKAEQGRRRNRCVRVAIYSGLYGTCTCYLSKHELRYTTDSSSCARFC